MMADTGFASALQSAVEARVTLLLGASDSGKTSLAGRLASELHGLGFRVAVVDADLGQSEIGPPTTIGLGRVVAPIARIGDVEPLALYWVGSTSPHAHVEATARGCRRMVERALQLEFDRVLVDTSGLVGGPVALALKRRKIGLVEPDLVLCLERTGECEPILTACHDLGVPAIRRLPVSGATRRRSTEERRQYRQAALERHFLGSRPVALDLSRTGLLPPEGLAGREGVLVGLLDAAGETLGLGRVVEIRRPGGTLVVQTSVRPEDVVTVAFAAGPASPVESTR